MRGGEGADGVDGHGRPSLARQVEKRTGVSREGREEFRDAGIVLCVLVEDGLGGPDADERVEAARGEARGVWVDVEGEDGQVGLARARFVWVGDPAGLDDAHGRAGRAGQAADATRESWTGRRVWIEVEGGAGGRKGTVGVGLETEAEPHRELLVQGATDSLLRDDDVHPATPATTNTLEPTT